MLGVLKEVRPLYPSDCHVAFLLGKPPSPNSLFPDVFTLLADAGVETSVHLPHQSPELPDWLSGVSLLVHRGLKRQALKKVGALGISGVPYCNSLAAVELTRTRLALMSCLQEYRLPVPLTITAESWLEARNAATTLSVIKTAEGTEGRGQKVLSGTREDLPEEPPFDGPYVVQPFIPNDGVDRKLYLAGSRVRGLLKPSPLRQGHVTTGISFIPDPELTALALRVGTETGLEFYGVDILLGDAGPVIVDVNPFPGYRDITDAPQMIVKHLLDRLG